MLLFCHIASGFLLVPGSQANDISAVPALCKAGGVLSDCRSDRATQLSIDLMAAMSIIYFVLTGYILMYKLRQYKTQPYAEMQVAVVFYRLQVKHSLVC
jgi:hypothetical protein